jgi:hypothetical protein
MSTTFGQTCYEEDKRREKEQKQRAKTKRQPPQTAAPHVSLGDFYAYMPQHSYIYVPTREMWPAASVKARILPVRVLDAEGNTITISSTLWLDQNKPVDQMTWAPGLPILIRDQLISEGGWIAHHGVTCFNLYRPPTIELGNAAEAKPWLDHAYTVYGEQAEHIIAWLAHRRQRPQEKINHALVLGGEQGIGKDTLLHPVREAVGSWNVAEVSPQHMLGRFNSFLKSVILRINEARDLGDTDRFGFYDHLKAYTAGPPDVLRIDEKYLAAHSILNCCGVRIAGKRQAVYAKISLTPRERFKAAAEL